MIKLFFNLLSNGRRSIKETVPFSSVSLSALMLFRLDLEPFPLTAHFRGGSVNCSNSRHTDSGTTDPTPFCRRKMHAHQTEQIPAREGKRTNTSRLCQKRIKTTSSENTTCLHGTVPWTGWQWSYNLHPHLFSGKISNIRKYPEQLQRVVYVVNKPFFKNLVCFI